MIMISNPDRLVSTGVPHALVLPMFQQLPTDVYDDLDGMTLDGNAVGAHQQQNDWDDDPDDDYPPPIPDGRPQGQNEFENDEAIYDSSEEPESYSTKQEDLYDSNDDLNQGDCIYDEAEFPDEEPVLPPRNDESFDNDYDDEDFSDDDEVPPPPPVARNAPKPIDTISVQHDALYSDDEDFSDDDVPPPVVRRNEPPPPPIVGRGGGSDGGAPPILGRAGSGDVDRNRYGMPDDNLEDDGPPPVLPPSRGKPAMPPPTEEFDDDFDVDDDDDSPPIPGRPPVRPPARHGSDEPRGNLPPLPPKPR